MRSKTAARTLLLEAGLFVAAFAYSVLGNLLFESARTPAVENARDLIAFQQAIHIDIEPAIQAFLQPHAWAMQFLVLFYAGPHFVLTLGFWAWAYWYRFEHFARLRNAFLLFTITAFTFQWIFPLAPPRFVPELGLTDSVTDSLPIDSTTPWVQFLVNDVAALPSIHTGWALLVALYAIRLTTTHWRWAWILYPATIIVSILGTANHFVWDIILAVAWLTATELALDWRRIATLYQNQRPQLEVAPETP